MMNLQRCDIQYFHLKKKSINQPKKKMFQNQKSHKNLKKIIIEKQIKIYRIQNVQEFTYLKIWKKFIKGVLRLK